MLQVNTKFTCSENKKEAQPVQLTSGSSAWKYRSNWSPDSKYLVYFDRTLNLKLMDIESKKEVIIDRASNSEIRDYNFSPDSKWIVYSKESSNGQPSVWVYNITGSKNTSAYRRCVQRLSHRFF
jgi:tricorn protease